MYCNKYNFKEQMMKALNDRGFDIKSPIAQQIVDRASETHQHTLDALSYMINYQNDPQDDFGTYQVGKSTEFKPEYVINLHRPVLDNSHREIYLGRKESCSHDMEKKFLLTSHYHKCKKCGFEE